MPELTAMVREGSSPYDSRSYCEPTHSAWESISGRCLVRRSVDTHLLSQVLEPGGTGGLEPLFFSERGAP